MFRTKVVEKLETHFMFNNVFHENHAVYDKMWKSIVELGRPQMTIWLMHIACWIPKATNTHSGCVILISFPLQQWLHAWASTLHYPYTACLVKTALEILTFY